MREIKFRAWAKQEKVMRRVEVLHWRSLRVELVGFNYSLDLMKDVELMQYTGLKDKNGKEGYHKDIVRRWDELYILEWHKNLVGWFLEPIHGGWHGITAIDMSLMCEVVGNIYENPELLEVK